MSGAAGTKQIITGRVPKFDGSQVMISFKRSESGEPLLEIREFFHREGSWHPSKAGITLGMGKARQIADAINMAIQVSGVK